MLGLAVCCGTVATIIASGCVMFRRRIKGSKTVYSLCLGVSSVMILGGIILALSSNAAFAAGAATPAATAAGWAFIAASLSTGIACISAAFAVANVGPAAIGLVGEKPEMVGSTLIYLGLAEGIAIYGLIVSLLILGKV